MGDGSPNSVQVKQDPSKGYSSARVKKQVIAVLALFSVLIVCVVLYVIASKGQHKGRDNANDSPRTVVLTTSQSGRDEVLKGAPASVEVIDDANAKKEEKEERASKPQRRTELELALEQEWIAIQKKRNQDLLAALNAPISVALNAVTPAQSSASNAYQEAKNNVALLQSQITDAQNGTELNSGTGQAEKLAFRMRKRSHDYLTEGRQAALSPYELKVGTLIPASLVGAINSDVPGQIIAQISQPVFDSATGSTELLPQGAKLVGTYDSRVGYGQERLPTVWTRINFPDGSVLNLGGMDGVDVAGQNGFTGDVDHHYWRIFGNALLLGVISGGTQAAVSDGNSNENSASEDVANGVVQQFSQTGNQLIQKNLNVQPTISLPNGYEFNIMLTKDVILPPYHQ